MTSSQFPSTSCSLYSLFSFVCVFPHPFSSFFPVTRYPSDCPSFPFCHSTVVPFSFPVFSLPVCQSTEKGRQFLPSILISWWWVDGQVLSVLLFPLFVGMCFVSSHFGRVRILVKEKKTDPWNPERQQEECGRRRTTDKTQQTMLSWIVHPFSWRSEVNCSSSSSTLSSILLRSL